MWIVKKVSSKVKKISQVVLKEESEAQKMIKSIIQNTDTVMSIKGMSELAIKSFQIEYFDNIVDFIVVKLNDIKMEKKSLKKRFNLLILVTYLIKHGAGGFIDQFRAINDTFTRYELLVENEEEEKDKFKNNLVDLSQRANYIKTLLHDKKVLAREKEIGRMVREKILTQNGDYSQQNKMKMRQGEGQGEGEIREITEEESKSARVESFLQLYVWKYTAKIDRKLDEITDIIIDKIDNYLDGQIPQSFEIDELEESSEKKVKKGQLKKENSKRKELVFMNDKLQIEDNLLDLKEEPKVEVKGDIVHENLPLIKLELDDLTKNKNSSQKQEGSQDHN